MYDVTTKNHESRQQEVYDFCEFFGTGYVIYIKNKFKLNSPPKIKNFKRSPKQYWIFSKHNTKIDEFKIAAEKEGIDFIILDNFRDRCFYMVKK